MRMLERFWTWLSSLRKSPLPSSEIGKPGKISPMILVNCGLGQQSSPSTVLKSSSSEWRSYIQNQSMSLLTQSIGTICTRYGLTLCLKSEDSKKLYAQPSFPLSPQVFVNGFALSVPVGIGEAEFLIREPHLVYEYAKQVYVFRFYITSGLKPQHPRIRQITMLLEELNDPADSLMAMQYQLFESEYFSEGEFLADVLASRLERATNGAVRTIKVLTKEPNPRITISVSNGRSLHCRWSEALDKHILATLILLNQGPGD